MGQRKQMKKSMGKKEERPLIQCGSTLDGVSLLIDNNIVPMLANSASGGAPVSQEVPTDRKRRRDQCMDEQKKSHDASHSMYQHELRRAKLRSIIVSYGNFTMDVNANMFAMVVALVL